MKKKLLGVFVIAVIAAAAGWNIDRSINETKLSDLGLANVEALASGEAAEVECESWHTLDCKVIIKDTSGAIIGETSVKGINKN